MLQRIALLAIAAPRRIVAAAVLVMVAAGIFGVPVASSLSSSGFQDPASESARAAQLLTDKFHQGDMQMLITVTAPDSATGPAARAVGLSIVDELRRAPNVAGVTSAWSAPPAEAKDLVSKDGKVGLIVAGLGGGESVAQSSAQTLSDEVARDHPVGSTGVIVRSGGVATVNAQITSLLQHDLLLMESIAIPLSFVVLVWVFGGLLAAALPVAVGLMAILGSMAVLRFITFSTDVSNLAPNLSTAMGLALAIDYTLLIISRYRDELADGADPSTALIRTMATAGRTVLLSATTVALSMAALLLFPMHVLKSFAYAGVATVVFAAIAAVVVTPAAIVLLGDRLNALDVRRLARRPLHRPDPVRGPIETQFWYRSTTFVMRRALPLGMAVVALLLVLGAPFLGVKWGFPDDRVLPTSVSAHQVGDQLRIDVGGAAHERERHEIHAQRQREAQVVDILRRERRRAHGDARKIDALVIAHHTALEHAAAHGDTVARERFEPHVAVVDQDRVAGAHVLRQLRVRGARALGIADARPRRDRELGARFERRGAAGEFAEADLRPLQVDENADRVLARVGRLAHRAVECRMLLAAAVREIEARDVHARLDQRAHGLRARGRGSQRAHDLGATLHAGSWGKEWRVGSRRAAREVERMGWMTGFEPATPGATVQCSTG